MKVAVSVSLSYLRCSTPVINARPQKINKFPLYLANHTFHPYLMTAGGYLATGAAKQWSEWKKHLPPHSLMSLSSDISLALVRSRAISAKHPICSVPLYLALIVYAFPLWHSRSFIGHGSILCMIRATFRPVSPTCVQLRSPYRLCITGRTVQ